MKNSIGKLVTASYRLRGSLARALHRGPISPDKRAHELSKAGVLVLKGLLSPADWAMILAINRDRFDRAHSKELIFSPDGVKLREAASVGDAEFARYYFLHIKHYHRKFDIYRMVDPLISPILKAFYRSNYYYRDLVCYRSQPVEPPYQGSYAWHRDNYPPGCLKVMVYLTDVLEESSGPLVYANGTHAAFRPQLGGYGPRIPREEVEGKHELKPCLGPRGTVILFDNNGVHRAANPSRGHREVINATILPCIGRSRPRVRGLDLHSEKGFWKKYTR